MNSRFEHRQVRVLFDETHNETWSTSKDRAREISPAYPEYSSYQNAADLLTQRDFQVRRNLDRALTQELLGEVDILALLHPSDPRWEKTVSLNTPRLSEQEIRDIQSYVAGGGSLLVVTEYEHDKYGDNLNELLQPFGLVIENHTVLDRKHCVHGNPAWVIGQPEDSRIARSIAGGLNEVCFYQAGTCSASPPAQRVFASSPDATPSRAGLLAVAEHGLGRVVVVTDSLLFGDDYLTAADHQTLWLNLCYWLAVPAFRRAGQSAAASPASSLEGWERLKAEVNRFRGWQQSDGRVEEDQRDAAAESVRSIIEALHQLAPQFPHQGPYFQALEHDFEAWSASGLTTPDFSRSLAAFNPQEHRCHGRETLVLFPLYTPNASLQTRLEALRLRMPWPEWLAKLERTRYRNDKFAPGHLLDFTDGYASECAVLFPETIAIRGKPTNSFATILCDREARRLQAYATRAVDALELATPPAVECMLSSLPLLEETIALWDLVHDRSHSLGELPFDPFMIRQRAPFWMYALEELRVDLRTFGEAIRLADEGFRSAQFVPFAILLDRIFRFPIVGSRVKNYDGLAGQLLFAFLHEKEVIRWCDNILHLDWATLPSAVDELRREIAALYRHGANCSKVSFWIEAHDLIARYVKPNVGSRWKAGSRSLENETEAGAWIALALEDEFPLGNFYLNLKRRLGPIPSAHLL